MKLTRQQETYIFKENLQLREAVKRCTMELEHKNRELEIEAALELVRARTMMMQHSNELSDVAVLLFKQVSELKIKTWTTGFNVWSEDGNSYTDYITSPQGNIIKAYSIDTTKFPAFREVRDAKNRGEKFWIQYLEGELLKETYKELTKFGSEKQYEKMLEDGFEFPSSQYDHFVFGSQVSLMFITYEPIPEAHDIFRRFGIVFDQTYTRFLDLQKAEAQAREALIEAALERVRARTMAMQRSEELQDAALLLFQQIQGLGLPPFACGFNIWDDDRKAATAWMVSVGGLEPPFKTDSSRDIYLPIYKASERGESLFVIEQSGRELEVHYQYLATIPVFRDIIMEDWKQAGVPIPTFQIIHCAYFTLGYLMFISFEPVPAYYDIFKRFAKVFEQTYTRFLDLQKAEAQAREAQIEVALERVRARTMAMQKSNELADAAQLLFQQFRTLKIETLVCGYTFIQEKKDIQQGWTVLPDGTLLQDFIDFPLTGDRILNERYRAWKAKIPLHKATVEGEENKRHHQFLASRVPAHVATDIFDHVPYRITFYSANFSQGYLHILAIEPITEADEVTVIRFAKVFDQTYTRFLDLQKAEAQAKEVIKASSLDRVRAQIASMRTVDDLQQITPIIWHELIALGVPFVRCGVFIINEYNAHVQVYLSSPDGHSLAVLDLPFESDDWIVNTVNHWRKGFIFKTHWNKEEFVNWMQTMIRQGQVQSRETYQGASQPPESLDLHFVPFKQGMLYVGNNSPLEEEELQLVKSLAESFSIAYARYEDFRQLEVAKNQIEKTFTELKATQSQLIQAEKMASLGELTAGIAHEIQNPLNFVNNFSEISNDLIGEMNEELDKGEIVEAKAIASDIKQNLEKILHHGKRADGIVKGMLQHSRISSGVKEPTDINKLADEYLRLAYHGLRAKDKSFNAAMKTDFDPSIGNINIIPQDIGRVILNLITNAFYAVEEKKQQQQLDGYEPTISVCTKKVGDKVLISIEDNGNGIPKKVLDKIFQPFFTTKPTGQGTGLGLSMSYDIVKAHGGELKVDSKEGEGAEFIIVLPVDSG